MKKKKTYISETSLIKEWDFSKNKENPGEVSTGSGKKVWWVCEKGHSYPAIVCNRARKLNPTGCGCCDGKLVCDDNCLATLRPDLAKEWHPIKNNVLTPNDVTCWSHKRVWWLCSKCGGEWEESVHNRTSVSSCKMCVSLLKLRPDVAAQWHPTKNKVLTPRDVKINSNKKVWWLCEKCGESWLSQISNRTRQKGGCPYCLGKLVCNSNCLATLFPDIAKEWHPTKNGSLTPNDVTCGRGKKVWWVCSKCGNEWYSTINHRTSGTCCPLCSKSNTSKISKNWLDEIGICCREKKINIPYSNKKYMKVDGFDKSTNTVYEFLGDFWHGNPKMYDLHKTFIGGSPLTLMDKYLETKCKLETLIKAGHKVKFVWESDYKNGKLFSEEL